ncbi:MAG: class I SAM-dependent RNA methyltransferase [Oscillospiraceae bacterium]|nr:class I SAM-dependent RNA methyltransferase [Oscillospiraceae bacterium]
MYTYLIPCLLGLEKLVGDEVRRLGLQDVQVDNGHVLCRGTAEDCARLNVNLRCGARVQLVLGQFPARSFEELFQGVRAIAWEDYLGRDDAFPVKGYSLSSALFSVPSCQSIVKKAVVERLKDRYHLQQFPETGRTYQIRFAIRKDQVTVGLDSSGEGLYKRGYRAVGVEAPLRETLAAAMVLLSRYRGADPFCDPFCGSGTIPIEAALIAKNRAPGLMRTFAAMDWAFLPGASWEQARLEARDREFRGAYDIWGGDVDPKAVEIARDNARKAGVSDVVRFERADVRTFRRDSDYGQLVTNPPYGERLLERAEAEELYRAFGQVWRTLPEGWRTLVLSSHTEFERAFGRPADKKRKLYNGMIKCDVFFYGKRV